MYTTSYRRLIAWILESRTRIANLHSTKRSKRANGRRRRKRKEWVAIEEPTSFPLAHRDLSLSPRNSNRSVIPGPGRTSRAAATAFWREEDQVRRSPGAATRRHHQKHWHPFHPHRRP